MCFSNNLRALESSAAFLLLSARKHQTISAADHNLPPTSRSTMYHLTAAPTATFSLPPYPDNGDCDDSRNFVTVLPANTSAQVASHLICISEETVSNFGRDNGYPDRLFEIFLSSRRQIPGKYLSRTWLFPNPSQFFTHQPPCCSTLYSLRQQQQHLRINNTLKINKRHSKAPSPPPPNRNINFFFFFPFSFF